MFDRVKNNLRINSLSRRLRVAFTSIILLLIFSGAMSLLELERVSHDTEEILMASKSNVDIAGEMIAALNEQNDAMIYMAVVGDERESHRVNCLNSIEHLRLATESACVRMSATDNSTAADSLRMQAERINQMANDYLDKRVHLHILESEATDSITPFNTQIWYADQYKVQYMNMSRHITKYMTGTNSTLGPEVNNLSHTARRAVTPVFISLIVMLVVVIMFYYFLRVYYLNPVLRINRSLGDYLTYKMPFDEGMEARDELKTLRDRIAQLISTTILSQNGETLHNHSHHQIITPGRLLVVDAGAESNTHYASDFTRTYPCSGKFTTKQREIYDIVEQANEVAFSLTKPGTSYWDVHCATVRYMLEQLKALDFVRGDVDEMVACGISGLFMPHGLGHNMGLDVHDMEDLGENYVGYGDERKRSPLLGMGNLRMARDLKPGHVISDEPGIYFIPALIEQWKREGTDKGFVNYEKLAGYYDFGGIRLEDDILVTADGARRLGPQRLPIKSSDIENIMANE